jgi:hypothetical protein
MGGGKLVKPSYQRRWLVKMSVVQKSSTVFKQIGPRWTGTRNSLTWDKRTLDAMDEIVEVEEGDVFSFADELGH